MGEEIRGKDFAGARIEELWDETLGRDSARHDDSVDPFDELVLLHRERRNLARILEEA